MTAVERNAASYRYSGICSITNDVIYGQLEGQTHGSNAFFVLQIPFNRTDAMPSASGLVLGMTQMREIAATQFFMQRTPMNDDLVRDRFGDSENFLVSTIKSPSTDALKAYPDLESL